MMKGILRGIVFFYVVYEISNGRTSANAHKHVINVDHPANTDLLGEILANHTKTKSSKIEDDLKNSGNVDYKGNKVDEMFNGTFSVSRDEIELNEIKNYKGFANDVLKLVTNGSLRHDAYKRLADFVDRFGPRMSGSEALDNSLRFLYGELQKEKLENVHGEEVMIPHWVRGNETARLIIPKQKFMKIRTLGSSVATPEKGIEANAIVVRSFDELKRRHKEVKGKIVVYNQEFDSYVIAREYRLNGASEAAKLGAVAALVRSVTPFSIYSAHTGWQDYQDGVEKIPVACLTVEDAEMLDRMERRGEPLIIKLVITPKTLPDVKSRNIIAEIKGYEKPEEIVIIGCHVDSWDIGQGAMDDGSGVFLTFETMLALVALGKRPKRTIRAVFWTAEETGMWAGAKQYYKDHKNDTPHIVMAMEADEGIYAPLGMKFQGTKEAGKIMKEISKLLAPINASRLEEEDVDYGQTQWFIKDGAPGAVLWTKGQEKEYFYYHHTEADTMTIVNADHLDLATALWATVTYVIADLDDRLPTQTIIAVQNLKKKKKEEKRLRKMKKAMKAKTKKEKTDKKEKKEKTEKKEKKEKTEKKEKKSKNKKSE